MSTACYTPHCEGQKRVKDKARDLVLLGACSRAETSQLEPPKSQAFHTAYQVALGVSLPGELLALQGCTHEPVTASLLLSEAEMTT